ncbi:type II toxin-antitoxin system RelE/ParE family toxin, partial [Escherichia coli]|nr:type II toxin-antitoxin system RelE/ParE family toxin [Escherichia coli]
MIRDTRKPWGTAQVRRYSARLEHGIADLAAGRGSFRDMSELFPELRMRHCEHQYVFCLPHGSAPALVGAIFHERMD